MKAPTTMEQFCEAVSLEARRFASRVWQYMGEGDLVTADDWMRRAGGEFLRQVLGTALSARASELSCERPCDECQEETQRFRQHRPYVLHTVLPGRDVSVWAPYTQCGRCHEGDVPLRRAVGADAAGFTFSLRALALKAATMEPYASASTELLGEFAGVSVSAEKLQSLVRLATEPAQAFVDQGMPGVTRPCASTEPILYAQLDGSMLPVDKAWQEIKLAILFEADQHVPLSQERAMLLRRTIAAVRGEPKDLHERLQPHLDLYRARDRLVVAIGDGAEWIWNLVKRLFPNRVEILDWYHVAEHVAETAVAVYGNDSPEAANWKKVQLDRLWDHGDVDSVLSGLRFLAASTVSGPTRDSIDGLAGYLENNRARVDYKAFRDKGYFVGSGAVESANSHTLQQRMKRTGMRWKAKGADALIALRCLYRSTDAWHHFTRFALRHAA